MNTSTNTSIGVFLTFVYFKNCAVIKKLIPQINLCKKGEIALLTEKVLEVSNIFESYSATFKDASDFIKNNNALYTFPGISEEELRTIPGYLEFIELKKEILNSVIEAIKRSSPGPSEDISNKIIELSKISGYNNSSNIH